MSRRRAAAIALCALIGLFWYLRLSPRVAPGSARPLPAESEPIARARLPEPVRPPPPPLAQQAGPPEAPIIDEVLLEKPEVCVGEENLVTVRAHTPGNKDDAYLHYVIGSEAGDRVPLVGTLNEKVSASRRITVFGRNNVATTVEVPHFEVRDCKAGRRLVIEHRLNPNTTSEFSFSAHIVDLATKKSVEPVRFLWSFGDGSSTETSVPVETHDYGSRPQSSHFTQLLVGCTAIGANGERVSGRDSLQLLNPVFEAFALKGVVALLFEITPRFPTLGADGVVSQKVRIWHLRPQPVRIERAFLTRLLDGDEPPPPEEVNLLSLLGTREIPPSGIEVPLALDTHAEPKVFARSWALEGVTVEGYPVRGVMSVMRPPELPTRDNSHPIGDPLLKAKIVRAREILARPYVTDEDLWKLEREGMFQDLVAQIPRSQDSERAEPPPGVRVPKPLRAQVDTPSRAGPPPPEPHAELGHDEPPRR
jgi:hypothetical protein